MIFVIFWEIPKKRIVVQYARAGRQPAISCRGYRLLLQARRDAALLLSSSRATPPPCARLTVGPVFGPYGIQQADPDERCARFRPHSACRTSGQTGAAASPVPPPEPESRVGLSSAVCQRRDAARAYRLAGSTERSRKSANQPGFGPGLLTTPPVLVFATAWLAGLARPQTSRRGDWVKPGD